MGKQQRDAAANIVRRATLRDIWHTWSAFGCRAAITVSGDVAN
jgi:hypothetical protein